MLRVNGFYGHVKRNDFLSVALFFGFLLSLQIVVAAALLLPLTFYDYNISPVMAPLNYLKIFGLPVTLLGAAWFWYEFTTHVRFVEARTGFQRVSAAQNPKLHRLLGPLAITAGIPMPEVAIIESTARNAFACGMSRHSSVIVVTRGLLNVLNDDELEAVLGHEVAHIATDDTRLLAAANIMLTNILTVQRHSPFQMRYVKKIGAALGVGSFLSYVLLSPFMLLFAGLIPVLIFVYLLMNFVTRSGLVLAKISRLAIATSREYVADAESVRLTHKPAALINALRKIEGKSAIEGTDAAMEAMMIDGATVGEFATHPTIAERIAVLAQHAGAMATEAFSAAPTFVTANVTNFSTTSNPLSYKASANFNPLDAYEPTSLRGLRAIGAKASAAKQSEIIEAPKTRDYLGLALKGIHTFRHLLDEKPKSIEKMSLMSRVENSSKRDLFGLTRNSRIGIIAFIAVVQFASIIMFNRTEKHLEETLGVGQSGVAASLRPTFKTVESRIKQNGSTVSN